MESKSLFPRRAVHWRAPTTMALAFAAGLLLAVGHHLFYADLHGRALDDARYGQQMNVRIGTALSYLVRASLVAAVGVAYWQLFWRTLLSRPLRASAIDSLADLLNALPGFFDAAALRASPVLVALAVVSWLVPWAAVVPPATLTVLPVQLNSSQVRSMAGLDFDTGPMATVTYVARTGGTSDDSSSLPGYAGSSQPLSRLALATAMQGELPSMPRPATNSSYRRDFDAPRVQCNAASTDILDGFHDAVGCDVTDITRCEYYYPYLAWTPITDAVVPFEKDSMRPQKPLPVSSEVTTNYSYLGAYDDGPASLFVAVDKQMNRGDWMVLNCSLWNATYTVDFDFSDAGQQVKVAEIKDKHPVGVDWLTEAAEAPIPDSGGYGPALGYQAVMECLGKLLVGSIFYDGMHSRLHQAGSVLQSEAAYTQELFHLYEETIVNSATYDVMVADAQRSQHFDRSLADVVEETFQNMTLALFSKQAFLGAETSPANVTTHNMHNMYHYESRYLLLSYGLAIGFSLISVALGSWSIWDSNASYSNKFTTIMRTTCGPYIRLLISSEDRTGEDPLREDLTNQKIRVGAAGGDGAFGDAESGAVVATDSAASLDPVAGDKAVSYSSVSQEQR